MPEVEIEKPFPDDTVHVTPTVSDTQVKGPAPVSVPYAKVGVFTPAFDRQLSPVHVVTTPSALNEARRAGDTVRHIA